MEKGNRLFHKLDKYVGIPIVILLGLSKLKKGKTPEDIKRIAILNIGSIGDNVLMSASIDDLKNRFPVSKITVFTGSTNFQIVQQFENINDVVKLPITNPIRTIKVLREYKAFDVLVDFGPWPRLNSIYSFFISAKFKIGFNSKNQYRHYVYDWSAKHSDQVHEIENYRSLILPLVDNPISKPSIKNNGTTKSKELVLASGSYCIIHPWPGGYKSYMKEWDVKKWTQLVNLIYKDFHKIIITGGPEDVKKSKYLIDTIKLNKQIDNVISTAGSMSLPETIDLIANTKIVFSVNTGIAHIAAAFDVNQICLHGPTNVKRWGPYSSKSMSIVPSTGKYGYLNFGFEYYLAQDNCMENISVDSVYKAYLDFGLVSHAFANN